MKLTNPLTVALFATLFAASLGACPGSSGGTGGVSDSGESSATGGTTSGAGGEAGAPGSGGVGVTGGANGDGGRAAGGSPGVGGIAATGGGISTGAVVGSGGASAGGGASGSGGRSGGGTSGRGGAAGATGIGGVAGRASGGATGSNTGGTGGGTVGGQGGSTGAGGGSSATVDCTDKSMTTYAFTKRYESGSIAVTDSTKTYYTQTNWWYKFGSQTVKIDGLSMTVGNPAPGTSVPSSDGNPTGFPSIFIGAYSGHETVGSNLPKQVSAIQSVPTIFQTNASTLDTSNFNATYDVWFTASGNKLTSATSNNPGKGGAYLMVWMFKPKDRQPRGGVAGPDSAGGALDSPNHAAHAVDGVPGAWDVWIDPSDPACISYVSSEPIDGLAFDLNKFIQDSVTNKYGLTSSMYLNLVFGGFEIWSGGDGLELEQFCAAVN